MGQKYGYNMSPAYFFLEYIQTTEKLASLWEVTCANIIFVNLGTSENISQIDPECRGIIFAETEK